MESDLLALHWMEHASVFTQAIGRLRTKTSYADATLACEGHFFSVHKFVLSTCSQYFNAIFEWTPCINPVVVINNVTCKVLEILLDFMYTGEVSVKESLIPDVMRAAECLRIRGLVNVDQDNTKPQLKSKYKSDIDGPPRKRKRTASSKKKSTPAGSDKTPTSCKVSGSNGHLSPPPTSVTSHQCSNEGEMYDTEDLVPDLAATHHTQNTPIKAETQDVDLPNTPSPNNTPSNSLQAPMSSSQSPIADEPVQYMPPPCTPTINQHSHISLPHHPTPAYHQCALDLTAREHTSEVSMHTAVEVLKSGKVKSGQMKSFVPEAHNEVAAEEIPSLIDSLVDAQPLCDPKPEPEDEVATLHAVEPNDNMHGLAEVVPSASAASSQEEVQHQEGPTVPGSSKTKNENSNEVKPALQCPHCNKQFTKKDGLSRHVRRHTKEPYLCNHCPFSSQKYRDVLDHKKKEHASLFSCSKCNFTTDRQYCLTRHVRQHEKPYHCTDCAYKASRPNMLKKHLENKHGKH